MELEILTTHPCSLSPMMVNTCRFATVSHTVPGSVPVSELIKDSTLYRVGCLLDRRGQATRSHETSRTVVAEAGRIELPGKSAAHRLRHPVPTMGQEGWTLTQPLVIVRHGRQRRARRRSHE